jgi:large subunit ribosomal protein L16
LRPRKFNYKNIFKRRSVLIPSHLSNNLNFGTQGLMISGNIALTAQKMFRMNLLLKKSARRADKTFRKLWFNAFPHLPLTKKVVGARMGKGKGKLHSWFTIVKAGNIIFEVKNLRLGRFYYFSKQIESRLGVRCVRKVKYSSFDKNNYYLNRKKNSIKLSLFR